MSYAIIRFAKLKTWGAIKGSASHALRERPTPNSDPDRVSKNFSDNLENSDKLVSKLKERLSNVKVRQNAVLTVEYLITASPEYFQGLSAERTEAYFARALEWVQDKHGKGNVLGSVIHYDETSPHMTVYVVPMVGDQLKASHFFDGREKLRKLQTDFADEVGKPFGLQRGIEGSKAKHQSVKKYYATLQAEGTKDPKVAQEKAKQYDFIKKNEERREKSLQELRDNSLRLRSIPLAEVLVAADCQPDPKDPEFNWKTPNGRISIDRDNRTKFYNHDTNEGGGGAIDLVCHLLGCQPREAMSWLARNFNERDVAQELAVKAKLEAAAAKAAPVPTGMDQHRDDPSTWKQVRNYLTGKRKIGEKLVDLLKARGKVWSDRFGNAVFPLTSDGKTQDGVYLRGTGPKPYHGVRGKKGAFIIGSKDQTEVAVVESPLDALSFRQLGFKGIVVATCGNPRASLVQMIKSLARTILVAFDNDPAGDQMAKTFLDEIPDARRTKPEGKDWNEDLVKQSGSTGHPGDLS